MNSDLINNKNSTVIKSRLCIVNVLCQQYYIFKVFIVECYLSVKLKNRSFGVICLYERARTCVCL